MGVLDDIVKSSGKRRGKDCSENLAEQVLGQSSHANDIFLDRQPGISERNLPRYSQGATVHQEGADDYVTNQVLIGTSPTQIVAQRASRVAVIVIQHGANDVFLGDANVKTTNGLLLSGNKGASQVVGVTKELFGVVSSGTQTISFMEVFSNDSND